MYYTEFDEGDGMTFKIIHNEPPMVHGDDSATYHDYIKVHRKPTFEEAQVIFNVCRLGIFNGNISKAVTTKITK